MSTTPTCKHGNDERGAFCKECMDGPVHELIQGEALSTQGTGLELSNEVVRDIWVRLHHDLTDNTSLESPLSGLETRLYEALTLLLILRAQVVCCDVNEASS
jgi:hypothetical protein